MNATHSIKHPKHMQRSVDKLVPGISLLAGLTLVMSCILERLLSFLFMLFSRMKYF